MYNIKNYLYHFFMVYVYIYILFFDFLSLIL